MKIKIDKERKPLHKIMSIRGYSEDIDYFKSLATNGIKQKDVLATAMRLLKNQGENHE